MRRWIAIGAALLALATAGGLVWGVRTQRGTNGRPAPASVAAPNPESAELQMTDSHQTVSSGEAAALGGSSSESLAAPGRASGHQPLRPPPPSAGATGARDAGLPAASAPQAPESAELRPPRAASSENPPWPAKPSRDRLWVYEDQKLRVNAEEEAPPLVGKQFTVKMLENDEGGGTFDCGIADHVPDGFEIEDPPPVLSAVCFRKPGFPLAVEWYDAGGNCAPDFKLAQVPRAKPNRDSFYPSDGAGFVYEGRAPLPVPDCFTSTCTVAPSEIPAGKTTNVDLVFSLVGGSGTNQRIPIFYSMTIPTAPANATIGVDRPPWAMGERAFTGPSCIAGRPIFINGAVAPEDSPPDVRAKTGGLCLPTELRLKLHVTATARGAIRLGQVAEFRRGVGEVVLPKATVSCPQADSIHHVAGTDVERFHEVTIKAR